MSFVSNSLLISCDYYGLLAGFEELWMLILITFMNSAGMMPILSLLLLTDVLG